MTTSAHRLYYEATHPLGKIKPPAYPGDAGMDVTVVEDSQLPAYSLTRLNLGLKVACPSGCWFTFITRSSAVVQGLFVLPTVIDEGYRGPLYLYVFNTGETHKAVLAGTRIAQLVLIPKVSGDVLLLPAKMEDLPSERGENGWGSSDKEATDGP